MACQAIPTLKMKQKSANLGKDMTLFGRPSQDCQPINFFQHCWKTFIVDTQVAPTTA